MDYAALLVKLRDLPKDKQTTVYDFVEFLTARYGNCPDDRAGDACSVTRIGEMTPNPDDVSVAYSADDLKERCR